MIGVGVFIVVVVLAIVGAILGTGRQAAAAGRARRAQARVQAALQGGGGDEAVRARVAALAGSVRAMPAQEAGALVLAGRQAFSRDIIPVLVAALGHGNAGVSEDAGRALADLGSPGLRAVWQTLDAGDGAPAALQAMLLRHPDWLFQRLVEGYAGAGEASVRRHESLWRADGMPGRLALLRTGSDAINALRANAISQILGIDGGKVA